MPSRRIRERRRIGSVAIILALVGWTGLYRQVRAEFIKHAARDYVRAAEAVGASAASRMFRHILPNVSHVILVRMSLLVVGFIKLRGKQHQETGVAVLL